MPMLWDVTSYPKAWSDLGFAVEHVASLQNEFGVQIEMARELDDKWSEEIKLRLLDMIPMFESFASQSGKPIDFAKTRRKRFPPLVKGLLAQGYCGEVLHDHEPCSALLLNMLAKFHRKHAPITRVRITSRVTARGKPSRTEKENWVTWQLPGDSLSGASNASPAEPTTKPQAIQAVKFSETTTYTPLRGAMEHGAENLDNDGLLAGDATDPALYAALVAEIYLEPVADADAEALQKAVEHLRAALGPQLRFSMTANNNAAAPRVFKYQPKHFENIAASLGTLTGSRYGSKLLYLMLNDDHQKEVDVSFKGTTIGAAKPTASASPWTVSFRARINEDKPEGVFVAPARLAFSVPMSFGLAPFAALLAQIVDGDLRIRWATAGYGYACWDYFRGVGDTIDLYRRPTKSKVARQRHHASEHLGFDIGLSENCFDVLNDHIRSVNWLTILGAALWHRLPESNRTDIVKRFSPEQLGRCLLIRASEVPQVGEGKAPPDYAALDAMLLPIRLRTGLIDDEWADDASTACDRWLARFETLS